MNLLYFTADTLATLAQVCGGSPGSSHKGKVGRGRWATGRLSVRRGENRWRRTTAARHRRRDAAFAVNGSLRAVRKGVTPLRWQ